MKVKKRIKRLRRELTLVAGVAGAAERGNKAMSGANGTLSAISRTLGVLERRIDAQSAIIEALERRIEVVAKTKIGTVDQEWAERIQRLERLTDSLATTRLAKDIGKELNGG